MSNVIDLDTIRAKAEQSFASTVIPFNGGDTVTLRNALRLSKEERARLTEINKELGDEDADQSEVVGKALSVVADDKDACARLLAEIGDDFGVLLQVFKTYNEGTQAGEA